MPDSSELPDTPSRWDPFALVAGLLAVLGAGLFLLDDLTAVDLPLVVLWPAAVLVLGVAIGVGSWTHWRRAQRTS